MANLIDASGALNTEIYLANNTDAYLTANLKACEMGLAHDTMRLIANNPDPSTPLTPDILRFCGVGSLTDTYFSKYDAATKGFINSIISQSDADSIAIAGDLTLTSFLQATTAKLTGLTDTYFPYHVSDAAGLANSIVLQTAGSGYSSIDLLQSGGGVCNFPWYNLRWSGGIAHGMTDYLPTDSILTLAGIGAHGGARIIGVSDDQSGAGIVALNLMGLEAATSDDHAAIVLTGALKSGTGATVLGATNTVLSVRNYTTEIMKILGDGKTYLAAGAVLFRGATMETPSVDTDTGAIWFNYYGYNEGTTRFRDFMVGNGKGVTLFGIDGSVPEANFYCSVTTNSTIQATTAKLTSLTDGYFPYHKSDSDGLYNSPLYTDGTKISIGTISPGEMVDIQTSDKICGIRAFTSGDYSAYFSAESNNQTSRMIMGVNKNAANNIFPGTDAYASVIGQVGNYAMHFGTNNIVRMTISAAGLVTCTSTIQATTAKLTNLSDNFFPKHTNDATGLENSNLSQPFLSTLKFANPGDATQIQSVCDSTSWPAILAAVNDANKQIALYQNGSAQAGEFWSGLNNAGLSLLSASGTSALVINQVGNYPIIIGTNTAERMRINATGVGIGTIPDMRLTVAGANAKAGSAEQVFRIKSSDVSQPLMFTVMIGNDATEGNRYVGIDVVEQGATARQLVIQYSGGTVKIPNLAGSGSRMVVADENGVLSAPGD